MKKLKCYIASPFFDKEGKGVEEIENIKKILSSFNISYFSPKDDNLISPNASYRQRKLGFMKNILEISKCDFMIANTRDKDIGTSIELGFAYAKKRPVILYTPQIKGQPINLMLSELCIGFAFDEKELKQRIRNFLNKKDNKFRGLIE